MAAFKYLAFVLGIVLVAVVGSILSTVYQPVLDLAADSAGTPEATTGVAWAQSFFDLLPLVLLGLLVFILIVGIVVRRNRAAGVR